MLVAPGCKTAAKHEMGNFPQDLGYPGGGKLPGEEEPSKSPPRPPLLLLPGVIVGTGSGLDFLINSWRAP